MRAYVCAYVCICACTCACARVRACACVRACVRTYVRTYVRAYVNVSPYVMMYNVCSFHVRAIVHATACVCLHTSVYSCVHVGTRVCTPASSNISRVCRLRMAGANVIRPERPDEDREDVGRGHSLRTGLPSPAGPRHVGARLLPDARLEAGAVHRQLVEADRLGKCRRNGGVLAHWKTAQTRRSNETRTLTFKYIGKCRTRSLLIE